MRRGSQRFPTVATRSNMNLGTIVSIGDRSSNIRARVITTSIHHLAAGAGFNSISTGGGIRPLQIRCRSMFGITIGSRSIGFALSRGSIIIQGAAITRALVPVMSAIGQPCRGPSVGMLLFLGVGIRLAAHAAGPVSIGVHSLTVEQAANVTMLPVEARVRFPGSLIGVLVMRPSHDIATNLAGAAVLTIVILPTSTKIMICRHFIARLPQ